MSYIDFEERVKKQTQSKAKNGVLTLAHVIEKRQLKMPRRTKPRPFSHDLAYVIEWNRDTRLGIKRRKRKKNSFFENPLSLEALSIRKQRKEL